MGSLIMTATLFQANMESPNFTTLLEGLAIVAILGLYVCFGDCMTLYRESGGFGTYIDC